MNISICDDEPNMAKELCAAVSERLREADVRTFYSGRALLDSFSEGIPDVVFLDIDMPQISGLEVAEHLGTTNQKLLLIFVTAHDELVYDSLRYHPFAFIRKKYMARELPRVLEDCEAELAAQDKRFHFRADGGDVAVRLSEIRYFEAEGNYLGIYMENGDCYRCRSTMTMVENALAHDGFIRIHKGFLVNQAQIKMLRQEELELLSGDVLPIGKCYAKEAKNKILSYMRE